MTISAANVHENLGKNMLVDGLPIVMDLEKSHDNKIYDLLSNTEYHDFFSCFASIPIGYNHPGLKTEDFTKKIGQAALTKVSNSDIYTIELAELVETFRRMAIPEYLPHLFFISGGALAVENALKTAFDWKVRKNWQDGVDKSKEIGKQIIHFKQAFHGRSGYTLSLTNTDPVKTVNFPKFDWPRIENPTIVFPLEDNLEKVVKAEKLAIEQIKTALLENERDIAALIIEPIQGEGGDNHFRQEFFHELQTLSLENDFLFILDEIQTGMGFTGKMWAHQHYGLKPDIISFGKKSQICGILVGKRIDEVEDNVFSLSSRINSTWGGNLTDVVRLKRYLEIIEEENLVENARIQGQYLLKELCSLQNEFPHLLSSARGLGLFVGIDLPNAETRKIVLQKLFEKKFIFLSCGQKTIRFRPMLDVTKEQIDKSISAWRDVLKEL